MRTLTSGRIISRRCGPTQGLSVGVDLEIVRQLIHLVRIDSGQESESVRNHFRGILNRFVGLRGEPSPDDLIYDGPEGLTLLRGALLEQTREIIVQCQGRSHNNES